MTPIILRPDQAELKASTYHSWGAGNRHVLVVLPTGGGKSIIVTDIVLDQDRAGWKQAVIAHRTELVGQMALHVARRGIYHRIIAPKNVVAEITAEQRREFGKSFVNPNANCSVAGIDTLVSRQDELKAWAVQQSAWTIDEAHHVLRANKWGKGVLMFPNARGLGVTASPARADGQGLGADNDGVFEDIIIGPNMRWLIDNGALTDYEIVVPPDGDFEIDENDVTATGDFSPKKMKVAAEKSHIVGDVVKEYLRWANGKTGITFAIDVEEATKIANAYNAAGVPAAAVSAKTPSATRSEFVRRLRNGQLKQLVNVDLFGEGFDLPAIEVVSMARPTQSLTVYLQQFGRALRTMNGKRSGLIIDHVSNYKRHGLPDKPRHWSLDRREKRGKQERDPEELDLTPCKSCSRPYLRALPACPRCGAVPPLPEPGKRTINMVDGDLRLLDASTLAQMRSAATLDSPAAVAERAGYAGGPAAAGGAMNRQIAKIQAQQNLDDALAEWAGLQRALGRSDAETMRRFYLTTGVDVLSARSQTGSDMDRMADMIRGWL